MEPHLPRVLDSEMAQPTDSLHRDQIARARSRISQRVVNGNTRTQQRGGFIRGKIVWHQCYGLGRHQHVFGVSSVEMDRRNLLDLAVHEVAAAARSTHKAMPAMPTDAHALARLPLRDLRANCINSSGDLVTRDAGILDAGPKAFFHEGIAVTDAARFHLDANLATGGLRDGTLYDFKISTGLADLNGFHADLFSKLARITRDRTGLEAIQEQQE
jgi:hypothetical protein